MFAICNVFSLKQVGIYHNYILIKTSLHIFFIALIYAKLNSQTLCQLTI